MCLSSSFAFFPPFWIFENRNFWKCEITKFENLKIEKFEILKFQNSKIWKSEHLEFRNYKIGNWCKFSIYFPGSSFAGFLRSHIMIWIPLIFPWDNKPNSAKLTVQVRSSPLIRRLWIDFPGSGSSGYLLGRKPFEPFMHSKHTCLLCIRPPLYSCHSEHPKGLHIGVVLRSTGKSIRMVSARELIS